MSKTRGACLDGEANRVNGANMPQISLESAIYVESDVVGQICSPSFHCPSKSVKFVENFWWDHKSAQLVHSPLGK
jgi:hypothetical protein